MSQVGKYFKETNEVFKESTNGRCEAYDCPLNGSLSSSVNSPWYCRFHHNFLPKDFDPITIKIKKYGSLIEILDICLKPEKFFNFDIYSAERTVKSYLETKKIENLYVEENLYKTASNILGFLHEKINLEKKK
jgi:hypothetical protein